MWKSLLKQAVTSIVTGKLSWSIQILVLNKRGSNWSYLHYKLWIWCEAAD
jgi:hypothetical protein